MIPVRRTTAAVAVVVATTGGLLAAVPASAAVSCASPVFKRQFFANTSFSGTARKTDCDSAISETWGAKAPASGLPTNNFGVRWTVTRDFGSGGPFTFTAAAQDGIRVYVDGVRKVSAWKNVSTTVTRTLNLTIAKGKHTLRVDYVNWTGSANVKFTYTPRTSAAVDKVRPLTPTGVVSEWFPGSDTGVSTVLGWAANKEMDLAGYRIYRQAQGETAWTKVGTTTRRTFTDNPPGTGKKYLYQVRAYDKAGNESTGTATYGPVPTPDFTAPAAPVLTATATEASNNLSWTASADAVSYRVFRRPAGSSTYSQLADTTATDHTDTSAVYGREYDYKVSAVDAAGNTADSAVVRTARTITPPSDVTASAPALGGVVITWKEPADGDTADYDIYRSATSADGSRDWTLASCNTRRTGTDTAGNTVRRCTDNGVRHGVTYHYKVIRQNTAGLWSTASPEVTVTTSGDELPPPPVTGLTAEPLEYGVKLDWDDSTAADLREYWIYQRTSSWETPQYVGRADAGTSEYLDGPLRADGESRTYLVVAVDIYGNSLTYEDESNIGWSPTVSRADVTELDLTPSTIPADTAPCSLDADATDAGIGVLHIDCAGADATGINVYRWYRTAGDYVRLTDVPLDLATTQYLDRTAPTGTTNHYVISVVAADGSEAFSEVDWTVSLPNEA